MFVRFSHFAFCSFGSFILIAVWNSVYEYHNFFFHSTLYGHCCFLVIKSCPTLFVTPRTQPVRRLYPWDFLGRNTGVRCHFLLQRIFSAQGSNLHLLPWQGGSVSLSHQGNLCMDVRFFVCLSLMTNEVE